MTCAWIPGDAAPACDWSKDCPDHGLGSVPTESHFGLDSFGAVSHKGKREDCSHPDCAWPREGDWVTAVSGGRERTGELIEYISWPFLLRTSSDDEFEIDPDSVRKPNWGTYCPHGVKVVEAIPAEHTCDGKAGALSDGTYCKACHPDGRKVQPWPCREDGCTEDAFDRAEQEEIDEYYVSLTDALRDQYR